ncbi:hypothetical protein [Roseovarius indicus]|uniref:N-acetyltransferase domain-containing protein n=1 Tax=Roseovarius indicus TaxID=540747 RepID=A0A0T5P3E7_9RHOB|nr:hypothetical protein [Roseovarius indicus]KRS15651.1 hypothetical protein XM52_22695 [Roseovarius indicus]QEW27839.1 hypothetical protein RIdsm_03660 [Roseovarius indicus]SFE79459.1 hypothetical protein SAMN04488031_12227 [Roseovarius indicus]
MIELAPFDNLAGMAVLSHLDVNDHIEAQLVRGRAADHLDIFCDWRGIQAHALLSLVVKDESRGGKPFAVLAVSHTGQAGVAQAAFLSRNHLTFRRALARAGTRIRAEMPGFCDQWGVRRIEARCWKDHPTAPAFLRHCGFVREADMPGFGNDGRTVFTQFAWINPNRQGS